MLLSELGEHRPRVLHVLNSLASGGAEIYVLRLARALTEKGFSLIVTANGNMSLRADLEACGVEVLAGMPTVGGQGSIPRWAWSTLRGMPRLKSLLLQRKIDIVHTHLMGSALPFWVACRSVGIPCVHTIQHMYALASQSEQWLYRSRLPSIMVKRFLTGSRYCAQALHRDWHLPRSRIALIPSGVDTARFRPTDIIRRRLREAWGLPSDAFVAGVTAGLKGAKNIDLAIRSIAHSAGTSGVPVHLVIAGDGPLRVSLEELAAQLGVSRRIVFLGYVQDTSSLLSGFDVYLQTTEAPNHGFAALEAMSCGIPLVIAARDAEERAMAEDTLMYSECGWVVTADPESIGSLLRVLAADRATVSTMRVTVRRAAVEHYDWGQHVRQMAALYRSLTRAIIQ